MEIPARLAHAKEAIEAWRTIRSLSKAIRNYVAQMKTSRAVPIRQFASLNAKTGVDHRYPSTPCAHGFETNGRIL